MVNPTRRHGFKNLVIGTGCFEFVCWSRNRHTLREAWVQGALYGSAVCPAVNAVWYPWVPQPRTPVVRPPAQVPVVAAKGSRPSLGGDALLPFASLFALPRPMPSLGSELYRVPTALCPPLHPPAELSSRCLGFLSDTRIRTALSLSWASVHSVPGNAIATSALARPSGLCLSRSSRHPACGKGNTTCALFPSFYHFQRLGDSRCRGPGAAELLRYRERLGERQTFDYLLPCRRVLTLPAIRLADMMPEHNHILWFTPRFIKIHVLHHST